MIRFAFSELGIDLLNSEQLFKLAHAFDRNFSVVNDRFQAKLIRLPAGLTGTQVVTAGEGLGANAERIEEFRDLREHGTPGIAVLMVGKRIE